MEGGGNGHLTSGLLSVAQKYDREAKKGRVFELDDCCMKYARYPKSTSSRAVVKKSCWEQALVDLTLFYQNSSNLRVFLKVLCRFFFLQLVLIIFLIPDFLSKNRENFGKQVVLKPILQNDFLITLLYCTLHIPPICRLSIWLPKSFTTPPL